VTKKLAYSKRFTTNSGNFAKFISLQSYETLNVTELTLELHQKIEEGTE
jgi:hypothetical protein